MCLRFLIQIIHILKAHKHKHGFFYNTSFLAKCTARQNAHEGRFGLNNADLYLFSAKETHAGNRWIQCTGDLVSLLRREKSQH